MKRIIYASSARIEFSPVQIEEILIVGRRKNLAEGLTGLLIHHENQFLQVIEGENDAVDRCFQRIKRDWRHHNCIVLADEQVASRAFADWQMAYRKPCDLMDMQQRQFADISAIAKSVTDGELAGHGTLSVFLRGFLSSFRYLNAA